MKTNELIDITLDWAVAKCNGYDLRYIVSKEDFERATWLHASRMWNVGGPIIEREKIKLCCSHTNKDWYAEVSPYHYRKYGPAPLIAAMRCYVASKLGDEVEIPEELKCTR
jgi:Protein of unknown function (DUF2591)